MYADLVLDVTQTVKDKMAALTAMFSLLSKVDHTIINFDCETDASQFLLFHSNQ